MVRPTVPVLRLCATARNTSVVWKTVEAEANTVNINGATTYSDSRSFDELTVLIVNKHLYDDDQQDMACKNNDRARWLAARQLAVCALIAGEIFTPHLYGVCKCLKAASSMICGIVHWLYSCVW